jgi:cytochrome c-type biogenesis protein CcmH/NrfF
MGHLMWFWPVVGLIIVGVLAVVALYERRHTRRGDRLRDPRDMEREIGKRGRFDGTP